MRTLAIITAALTLLLAVGPITASAEVRHRQTNEVTFITWVWDDPWQPEGFDEATSVQAPWVEKVPVIDGRADDEAWARAESITVPLAYGPVKEATLKAVYTEGEVFLLVSWPDPTRDDIHHPWVWDAEQGRYVESPQVEDSLMVSFEAGCEWTPSLLSGYMYDYDGWRWLAARTNPVGQAVDVNGHTQRRMIHGMGFVKYKPRATEPSWQLKFNDPRRDILTAPWYELKRAYMLEPIWKEIYVSMEPDGKRPPAFAQRLEAPKVDQTLLEAPPPPMGPKPAYAITAPPPVVPQFKAVGLMGDAGEVAAKGRWADGRWTVEFRRVLETPARTMTDVIFERVTQLSLHIFDHTERVDEASESGRLWLQFLPAE